MSFAVVVRAEEAEPFVRLPDGVNCLSADKVPDAAGAVSSVKSKCLVHI